MNIINNEKNQQNPEFIENNSFNLKGLPTDLILLTFGMLDTETRTTLSKIPFYKQQLRQLEEIENHHIKSEFEQFLEPFLLSVKESQREDIKNRMCTVISSTGIFAVHIDKADKWSAIKKEVWKVFADQIKSGELQKLTIQQTPLIELALAAVGGAASSCIQPDLLADEEFILTTAQKQPEVFATCPTLWNSESFVNRALKINLPHALTHLHTCRFIGVPLSPKNFLRISFTQHLQPWKKKILGNKDLWLQARKEGIDFGKIDTSCLT